jgi:transposase, IS5 family
MGGRDQLSFADAVMDPRLGVNETLQRIDGLVDWGQLEAIVRKLRKEGGRPPFPALGMLKALYLQSLYGLSDPGMEEALLDRLSFRRFCGFGLDARTPDETTICRFRLDAAAAGVLEECFACINRQLEARGLFTKKGTLIDATLIAASHNKPSFAAGGGGAVHPRDPDATFTRKNGRTHFGFKGHVGADEGTLLVRKALFTPNAVSDSEAADALISWDEQAVYADRGYPQKARRQRLREAGIRDRIMHRRHKSQKDLPQSHKRHNALIARRRAPVESIFSVLKRIYGQGRARCRSLAAAGADFFAALTMYNLRRALRLGAA